MRGAIFLFAWPSLLLLVSETLGSFPKNKPPITRISLEDVRRSIFTGGDSYSDRLSFVQDVQTMKIAGRDMLAVTARNNFYVIDPDHFSPESKEKVTYDGIFSWTPDEKYKGLCVLKGHTEINCDNYFRVLQSTNENGDELLACGTNSYSPLCKFISVETSGNTLKLSGKEPISGTEKCAFGPDQTGVSLYTNGSFYSATVSEFTGRSYTITRNFGSSKQLRTPRYDTKFLNEPEFVKMADDGERVLVYINEALPSENGDVRMVAHVAQVCKNDGGGQHVMVRQWTKFVKTRLNCSLNGFYFDQLQDVSDPVEVRVGPGPNDTEKMVFAAFTTPDNSVPGSAVCGYPLSSIHDALRGRFREERNNGDTSSDAPTGDRHPGLCPKEQYTESELQFMKSHPLLEDQVRGTLFSTYTAKRWSAIAVDAAAGPYGNWTVYFVGTSDGSLVRYLAPTSDMKSGALLAQQEVYDSFRCEGNSSDEGDKRVTRVIVDPKRDSVLVSFKHCVISVPLRTCSIHICKEACLASADPYCGWNGDACISYTSPDINVEQYVLKNIMWPKTNLENLCVTGDAFFETRNEDDRDNTDFDATTPDEQHVETGAGKIEGNDVNGTANGGVGNPSGEARKNPSNPEHQPQEKHMVIKNGYVPMYMVGGIAAACAIGSFVIGLCVHKWCCRAACSEDKEMQTTGLDQSKGSLNGTTATLCKKAQSFIASISPKRKRKMQASSETQSIATLNQTPSETPLLNKSNKMDEVMDVPDSVCSGSKVSTNSTSLPKVGNSRVNSVSSNSHLTLNGSSATFNRRVPSQMTGSVSSMPAPQTQYYATAPRPRHPSGNRSSDPVASSRIASVSDYSTASTLRADSKRRTNSNTRHSTPVPPVPPSPCRSDQSSTFSFLAAREVVDSTEHTLRGVEEVIAQVQRRSQEMETVVEDDESRPRHDSTDSGNGESPRNSLQNEEERANKVSTLPRPDTLLFGQRTRRQRLNSEPTSPTMYHAPPPPPSSRKPVTRSTSMRTEHVGPQVIPNQYQPKRSGSFSHNSPSTPVGQSTPPRNMGFPSQNFQQQPQHMYATLPTNPNGQNIRRAQNKEHFNRQQSYDTYSPNNHSRHQEAANGYPMGMPDKYSSLPLRAQAHRSKQNPVTTQYNGQHPAQTNRHSGSAMPHPQYQHQWSSPAAMYEQQRPANGQRLRYVPTPTVPTTKSFLPATLPETDAV